MSSHLSLKGCHAQVGHGLSIGTSTAWIVQLINASSAITANAVRDNHNALYLPPKPRPNYLQPSMHRHAPQKKQTKNQILFFFLDRTAPPPT